MAPRAHAAPIDGLILTPADALAVVTSLRSDVTTDAVPELLSVDEQWLYRVATAVEPVYVNATTGEIVASVAPSDATQDQTGASDLCGNAKFMCALPDDLVLPLPCTTAECGDAIQIDAPVVNPCAADACDTQDIGIDEPVPFVCADDSCGVVDGVVIDEPVENPCASDTCGDAEATDESVPFVCADDACGVVIDEPVVNPCMTDTCGDADAIAVPVLCATTVCAIPPVLALPWSSEGTVQE
jgi:hypothetical protein